MSYGEYEDSDVKTKKSSSKDSGRTYSGPCPYCRARLRGISVDKDGKTKCSECNQTPAVAKKL